MFAILLGACGAAGKPDGAAQAAKPDAPRSSEPAASDSAAEGKETGGAVLTLSSEELANLQIVVTSLQTVTYAPSSEGFGIVLGHEVVAQAVADLETASAAARQSQSALDRGKRLVGGPGALGLDAVETAARQLTSDQAALALAQRKLTAVLGLRFPRPSDAAGGVIEKLANGSAKLARITFPPGELGSAAPKSLSISFLDAPAPKASWMTSELWDAPQDPSVPGRSYFAVLRTTDIPEGARVQALAIRKDGETGVVVPSSAVVISNGQYWVYVKKSAGAFARLPIDITRPLAEGYFVPQILSAGDAVVTSGAGLLLARQMNGSSEGAD